MKQLMMIGLIAVFGLVGCNSSSSDNRTEESATSLSTPEAKSTQGVEAPPSPPKLDLNQEKS